MKVKLCLKGSNGTIPRGPFCMIPSMSREEYEYTKRQLASTNIELLDDSDNKYEDMDALAKKREADAAIDVENAAKSKAAANAPAEKPAAKPKASKKPKSKKSGK